MIERNEKVAFITGAASGIGKATTEAFSRSPKYKKIYAADIDPAIHVAFNPNNHPHVIPVNLDIRSFNQTDIALNRAINETEIIDVLVNCAGVIAAGDAPGYGNEHADRMAYLNMVQVNDASARHILDKTAEIMKKGRGGTIIMITSSKDHFPDPFRRGYERTKTSLEYYSLWKSEEYARDGVKIVVVKPGNTKTNIDRGSWISPDSQEEMISVQNFNDWWRKVFGNDPKNVAEAILKIAEGKIKGSKVFVGFDAKLGRVLAQTIPGWRKIFFLGSSALYKGVVVLGQLKREQIKTSHAIPVDLSGEWFEEGLRREAAAKVSESQQVIKIGNTLYLRVIDSRKIDGNLQGSQVNSDEMKELGVSQEALEIYLDSKMEKLGNKTMLFDDCEPGPEGDWEYRYNVHDATENSCFGIVTVTFKGEVIFNHFITVSKFKLRA